MAQSSAIEIAAMRRAIELAYQGSVNDINPRVGCVVLQRGVIVGQGWHCGSGSAHAEIVALAEAGDKARGATVVVTLEPCSHQGKTGPCAAALIAAGVSRVVIATSDPNLLATGGADLLRSAGIDISVGLCAAEAEELNASWLFAMRNKRPFVTWKFAATLDGHSAASDGSSAWITSDNTRVAMSKLRGECGAVLVGTRTLALDNPLLTARDVTGVTLEKQPLRVVMGLSEPLPHCRAKGDDGLFRHLATRNPTDALAALYKEGVHHVWLEGGPTLAAAFMKAGLIDRVLACLAPAFLGAGSSCIADLEITNIADMLRFSLSDITRYGDDLVLTLTPTRKKQ